MVVQFGKVNWITNHGIDIIDGEYGLVVGANNIINEICTCNGIICFVKVFFVVVLFEFVNLNHLKLL